MGKFTGKFESARQDWETPLSLFNLYDSEFKFTLDAATSKENTKCKNFINEKEDGLKSDWGKNIVWLNPPYGKGKQPISAWIRKASDSAFSGATSAVLIPARTNTNWFHDICLRWGEVRFIRGRPKFGGAEHGLPQPLCVVIFYPRKKP